MLRPNQHHPDRCRTAAAADDDDDEVAAGTAAADVALADPDADEAAAGTAAAAAADVVKLLLVLLLPMTALIVASPVAPAPASFPSPAILSTPVPPTRVVGGNEGVSGPVPLLFLPRHLHLPMSAKHHILTLSTIPSRTLNVSSASES